MKSLPVFRLDPYELHPLTIADTNAFFDLMQRNKPRLEGFFAGLVGQTSTLDDTRIFLEALEQRRLEKTYLPYILIHQEHRNMVCFLDLKNIDWKIPKAELGCFTDSEFAGSKITQQALKSFTQYCFEEMGFIKLFLRTHEENHPARRIAEKCGFALEGKIRKDYKNTAGDVIDLLYYGQVNPTFDQTP